MAVVRPDPDAAARRVRFDHDGDRQDEGAAVLGEVEFELADGPLLAERDRERAVGRLALGQPGAAGPAELAELGLAFDPADPRVIDADAAGKGFEQADRVAAQEGGLGGVEVLDLADVGRFVGDLAELGEPHGRRLHTLRTLAVPPLAPCRYRSGIAAPSGSVSR